MVAGDILLAGGRGTPRPYCMVVLEAEDFFQHGIGLLFILWLGHQISFRIDNECARNELDVVETALPVLHLIVHDVTLVVDSCVRVGEDVVVRSHVVGADILFPCVDVVVL